ncbi:MAG: helix-hairpin-helix domain-containing protein, partial [Thaumarchaeota archaeon]|nr:helix-hairpin-helix domain-containing protein [Nitrososphaerota archaeon]
MQESCKQMTASKKKKSEVVETIVEDCYSLEGLPGFGPTAIKVLLAEGVSTTEDLAKRDPVWLKEVTGMDKDKAAEAYQ